MLSDPQRLSDVIAQELRGEVWDEYRDNLAHWLMQYLALPMVFSDTMQPTALSDLTSYKAEPEFWLPVIELEAEQLDALISGLSLRAKSTSFRGIELNGMLKALSIWCLSIKVSISSLTINRTAGRLGR